MPQYVWPKSQSGGSFYAISTSSTTKVQVDAKTKMNVQEITVIEKEVKDEDGGATKAVSSSDSAKKNKKNENYDYEGSRNSSRGSQEWKTSKKKKKKNNNNSKPEKKYSWQPKTLSTKGDGDQIVIPGGDEEAEIMNQTPAGRKDTILHSEKKEKNSEESKMQYTNDPNGDSRAEDHNSSHQTGQKSNKNDFETCREEKVDEEEKFFLSDKSCRNEEPSQNNINDEVFESPASPEHLTWEEEIQNCFSFDMNKSASDINSKNNSPTSPDLAFINNDQSNDQPFESAESHNNSSASCYHYHYNEYNGKTYKITHDTLENVVAENSNNAAVLYDYGYSTNRGANHSVGNQTQQEWWELSLIHI